MSVFSFRADSIQDVFDLLASPQMNRPTRITIFPDPVFPDVEVEIVVDMIECGVVEAARTLSDAHVIVETLRECGLESNSLRRCDSLEHDNCMLDY